MKNFTLLFACLAILITSCQSGADQAAPAKSEPTPPPVPAGWHFRVNKAPMIKGELKEGNWCQGDFSENVVVNANHDDYNKRYFIMGPGVYKVIVNGSKGAATFMLRQTGPQEITLSSAAQYPTCLSSWKNFSVKDYADHWGYDNSGGIYYTVNVTAYEQWARVELYLAPEGGYGLVVQRCTDCK